MKQKHLLMLLGALVVLLAIYYLVDDSGPDASTIRLPELVIPADEVEQLSVVTASDSISLAREGITWMLRHPVEFLSDSTTVSRLLQDAGGLELETVASDNPDRYGVYGVDSSATEVTLVWPGGTRRLLVGNPGPDFQSVYVRVDDDARVFATRGRVTVQQDLDRWRDRRVVDVPVAAIQSVSVVRPAGSYDVVLEPEGWQIDGAAADSLSVVAWLRRFDPMRADGFLDELPPAIFADASYQLAIRTAAGTTEILRLMEYEDALGLTTAEEKATYRLLSSRLDSFFPDPESLQ